MDERTADPYRDLDVIDAHAPRVNQAVIGAVALLAVATGWWPLLGLLCLQLVLGLTMGRRWCLACVAYFELLQPRIGEGPLEDSRPPRFANLMGVVVLTPAAIAYLAGLPLLGAVLGLLVAALALLSAATGFCTGCQIYKLGARVRGLGRGHGHIERIELSDFGDALAPNTVVQFTHPLCSDCHRLERELRDEGRTVVTAVTVDGSGAVLARLA